MLDIQSSREIIGVIKRKRERERGIDRDNNGKRKSEVDIRRETERVFYDACVSP